jgi:hypothetical protein
VRVFDDPARRQPEPAPAGTVRGEGPRPARRDVPPHNLEAEATVLGSILLDPDAIVRVQDVLGPDDFYRENHGQVFRAALVLRRRGIPIDNVTVAAELEKMGILDRVGGPRPAGDLAGVDPDRGECRALRAGSLGAGAEAARRQRCGPAASRGHRLRGRHGGPRQAGCRAARAHRQCDALETAAVAGGLRPAAGVSVGGPAGLVWSLRPCAGRSHPDAA